MQWNLLPDGEVSECVKNVRGHPQFWWICEFSGHVKASPQSSVAQCNVDGTPKCGVNTKQ